MVFQLVQTWFTIVDGPAMFFVDVSADIESMLGANILVKYLGEDGDNAPVSGAAAISIGDFLIGDRFIRHTYRAAEVL